MHFRGRLVTLLRIVRARLDEHIVELQQTFAIRPGAQLRIDFREIESIFSGASFVKNFAKTVNVGARGARSFWRHVAFRSHK